MSSKMTLKQAGKAMLGKRVKAWHRDDCIGYVIKVAEHGDFRHGYFSLIVSRDDNTQFMPFWNEVEIIEEAKLL